MLQKVVHLVCVCVLEKKHRDTVGYTDGQTKYTPPTICGLYGSPEGFARTHNNNDRRDCPVKKKKLYFISVIEKHYCIGMYSIELFEPDRINLSARHSCTVYVEWTFGRISTQKVLLSRIMFCNVYNVLYTHTQKALKSSPQGCENNTRIKTNKKEFHLDWYID